MAQMKDKKQQLDEWFDLYGDNWIHTTFYGERVAIKVRELYKMFKLGIELGYEPEENDG